MSVVRIRHFTDPGCPFAFSAEPVRLKLRWQFGDQLEWEDRMVVLSRHREENEARGFTPAKQAAAFRRFQRAYGMPIDPVQRDVVAATEPACRAVVAARIHAADGAASATALLRRLRIHYMDGGVLDDPVLIAAAARNAGLDPEALAAWMEDPATRAALEEDACISRHPAERALALEHKLAAAGDGRRYTCPSYELERTDGTRGTIAVPGFQPFAAYEVVFANLAPELERRDPPADASEALAWAGEPLASEEVAQLLEVDRAEAREDLARVASERPAGAEGWWALREE